MQPRSNRRDHVVTLSVLAGLSAATLLPSILTVQPAPSPAGVRPVAAPTAPDSDPLWLQQLTAKSEDPADTYLDVCLSRFDEPRIFGRSGAYPNGEIGMAMQTTACNVGSELVTWIAAMDPRHPFILQNLYRISDGRLEQIGVSWAKHSFYALDQGLCGVQDCTGNLDDNALDLGCSDTYDARTNADRAWLGPRSEINPFTAEWDPCGSLFDIGNGTSPDCRRSYYGAGAGPTDHLTKIKDADLLVPGATYVAEGRYIVAGDDEPLNNTSYHQLDFTSTGSDWNVGMVDRVFYWPYVMQWGDMQNFATPRTDGTAIVSVRTVDLGNGSFRYEYAVYNHDIQRKIQTFSVPVAEGVTVTNIGFNAATDEEDIYDLSPWSNAVSGTGSNRTVSWWTDAQANNPLANTLRFASTYTFWFEADSAPVQTTLSMDLFETGSFPSLSCPSMGPRGGAASALALSVGEVHKGQGVDVNVSGARPNERVYILYSFSPYPAGSQRGGLGRTFSPALNLDVDLAFPIVKAATVRADGSGQASFHTTVYSDLPPADVAVQAVVARSGEESLKSNVALRRVLD